MKPIKTADLKGLKIRCSPTHINFLKELGAQPLVIPPPEGDEPDPLLIEFGQFGISGELGVEDKSELLLRKNLTDSRSIRLAPFPLRKYPSL
ncbi:MAG: hypothetical protein V1689_06555 [Pseudomonadota bacterium]